MTRLSDWRHLSYVEFPLFALLKIFTQTIVHIYTVKTKFNSFKSGVRKEWIAS